MAFHFSLITPKMSGKAPILQHRFLMAWVWFNSISSQARINVLLIEPLLHQIKVLADGLACSLPSAMKGIISIHYFTLYNIPIINELQLWSPTRSIMVAAAGCINHRQKQVCGSSTRDKLIIRFTMMNCVWTDRTSEEPQWTCTNIFIQRSVLERHESSQYAKAIFNLFL